jgi:hypothetical protein
MEIDPPDEQLTFTPTSAWEANYLRAYGVQMCQDNGVDEVSFTAITSQQFKQTFTVTSEGRMTTSMDLDPRLEFTEVRRIHHV